MTLRAEAEIRFSVSSGSWKRWECRRLSLRLPLAHARTRMPASTRADACVDLKSRMPGLLPTRLTLQQQNAMPWWNERPEEMLRPDRGSSLEAYRGGFG